MGSALEAAIAQASLVDPLEAAARSGFEIIGTAEEGTVVACFLGREVRFAYPGFAQEPAEDALPPHVLAILLYHFASTDGAEPAGRWIAFTDLPDGTFYVSAWRGYTGQALVRRFGDDVEAVRAAARALGGRDIDIPGDVAVEFQVMPKVPVAFVYWGGDEEFEPRADFLFDANAASHLPTDCYAVMCSWITGLLAKAGGSPEATAEKREST